MNRRRYLSVVGGLSTCGLAGCTEQFSNGDDTTSTASSSNTQTGKAKPNSLTAGSYTALLTSPRVRASILTAGVHLDVRAEPDTQFLLLDIETTTTPIDELPVSLVADGKTIASNVSFVGRPDSEQHATVAFPVPVTSYESVDVVLTSDGESDQWTVSNSIVAALGSAPDFEVESIDVPESVQEGDPFEASFTVANRGDRDGRFLAEFGHALISDTGEVEFNVAVGETRTHTQLIEPYYESNPDTIPVVLNWGLDQRRAEVNVVTAQSTMTDHPPVNEDLVIQEQYAVEGTMVNMGAEGTAKNTATTDLVNCVIDAQGDIGDTTFSARTKRERLSPNETWEWSVAFGEEADAQSDDSVENLSTVTRAEYAE